MSPPRIGSSSPKSTFPTGKSPFPTTIAVKRGDTLSSIAKAHGTTVKQLVAANPQLKDPNKISAGSQLHRPAPQGKITCRPPDDFQHVKGKRIGAGAELKGEAAGKLVGAGAGLGAKAKEEDPFKTLKLVGTGWPLF